MNTPLISIITITFNAEKNLPATMDSIYEQNFHNFEHIIVDGASRDNTLAVARSGEKTRILSEPDKGLYDAMNKGLKMAKGKYVIFLNAGDSFHSPETLSQYAAKALQDCDIIYGDTIIVDSTHKPLGPRHYSVPKILTKHSFAQGMLICHQAFMVKRELAPLYDTQYRFSADYDWCIKCIKNANISRCHNLGCITINYLSDGLTDNNKIKSLRERYRIMASHYGLTHTIWRHAQLIGRAIIKKR